MVEGIGPHGLSLAPADCCAECSRTRGCNVWVACADARACGSQCWLKFAAEPMAAKERARGPHVPWTSGVLDKDVPSRIMAPPDAALQRITHVALRTQYGDLRIRLRPEWHEPSVRWVQRVALADACTINCVFYRAEPGFLLQARASLIIAACMRVLRFRAPS